MPQTRRGHIAIPKGHLAPLVLVKISLAFPLYVHTKTYPRPVLHFRASAIPNEIVLTSIIRTPSASTADSATPVFFSSSKSTLSLRRFCTLVAFPSGDAGRLGGPSTSARRCAYSASRCACLHRPKPGATCACFCSISAPDHGRKGRVQTDLDGLDANDLECTAQLHPQLMHPRPSLSTCCSNGMPIRNQVGPVDARDTPFPAGRRTTPDAEERVCTRGSRSDQWNWLDPA